MSHGWTVQNPVSVVPPLAALLTVAALFVALCVAPSSAATVPSPAVRSVAGAGSAAPRLAAHRPPTCTRSAVLVSSEERAADQVFPVSAAGKVDCVLARGATGAGVRTLQRSLNVCYRASLQVDGVFGRRTRAALVAVQRSLDVSVDGRYDPGIRRVMYRDGGFAWRDRDGGGFTCIQGRHPARLAMHTPPPRTLPTT
ncbi:MAG: peptidoglycan-binding protein, partial [Actinomycetales bacterium]|nr:peptidoglycan-binding protein [Actinomycetales bacterium]